jgi:hypothetical protein
MKKIKQNWRLGVLESDFELKKLDIEVGKENIKECEEGRKAEMVEYEIQDEYNVPDGSHLN